MWTMDELVERVGEALAAEYPGAPNGRVRDVPDRRAIRWYTSIGLVDRPLGMRGRTALYGPRHLQQLVAIKRRQAEGQSLAQIQVEFTWLSPDALIEVSRVPPHLLDGDDHQPGASVGGDRPRFWAQPPTASAPEPATRPARHQPARHQATARPVSGVALDGGVLLIVPHTLSDADRADIAAAAAPLLDLLEARGLTDGRSA